MGRSKAVPQGCWLKRAEVWKTFRRRLQTDARTDALSYYHGMEGVGSTRDELDGFDMRKSMPKDVEGTYVRENGKEVLVTPDQVWA